MRDTRTADQISDALNYRDDMPVKPFRFGAVDARKRIEQAQKGQFFFTTGIATLDRLVRLRPATYTIIAAQSGTGKTALAMQLADHVERVKRSWGDDRGTLIFSAEMAAAELAQRMVATELGISVWEQEGGDLTREEEMAIYDALDRIAADRPFQIDESNSPDRDHIYRSCDIVAKSGGLSMVVLDYIELAASDEKFKAEHVRSVAKTLKNVSRDYGVPSIGLSQINKDNQHRGTKKPEMTDLRYGGHEPADTVIILQERDDVEVPDGMRAIDAWVVKNRGGRQGKAEMLFDGAEMLFLPADFSRIELNY